MTALSLYCIVLYFLFIEINIADRTQQMEQINILAREKEKMTYNATNCGSQPNTLLSKHGTKHR